MNEGYQRGLYIRRLAVHSGGYLEKRRLKSRDNRCAPDI
jgi:hypothetical protein